MCNQIPTLHTISVELLDFLNGCGIWTKNLSSTGVCATKLLLYIHTIAVELLDFLNGCGIWTQNLSSTGVCAKNPYITYRCSGIVIFFNGCGIWSQNLSRTGLCASKSLHYTPYQWNCYIFKCSFNNLSIWVCRSNLTDQVKL